MEISGVEPEMTICNIDVLPIKLYPPPLSYNNIFNFNIIKTIEKYIFM